MKSLHLVLGRPLGRFPVGVASHQDVHRQSFLGHYELMARTNVAEISL